VRIGRDTEAGAQSVAQEGFTHTLYHAGQVYKMRIRAREEAINEVLTLIHEEADDGFPRFQGFQQILRHYYHKALVPFLKSIPREGGG